MKPYLACSQCDEMLIKKSLDNTIKIRAKVILVKNNQTFAVCKGCNAEIPIPLTVDTALSKSLLVKKEPKLYLKE